MKKKLIKFKILKYFLRIKKVISKLKSKTENEKMIIFFKLFASFLLGILIGTILINLINGNGKDVIGLISALAILISALLASYSLMLSIDVNVKLKNIDTGIKNREQSNRVRYVFFQLCQIKTLLITLENEKKRAKISHLDIDRIFNTFHEIKEMLSEIDNKDVISTIHNNILTDVHLVISIIRTHNIAIKAIRTNTIKPVPQKSTEASFKNPLIGIDFKLEDTISKLTKILSYLKDAYPKEFKKNGGIEGCAEYQSKLIKDS